MAERTELADFLRARRGQLRPSDVGLPDAGRRRTPGLRREEVAALAGVSIDYLVRLEQGRDANPSPAVLTALADALLLSESERMHLGKLAIHASTAGTCRGEGEAAGRAVAPTVQAVLDQLDPMPGHVVDVAWDLLGWNPAWQRLARSLGLPVGPVPEPNLAGYLFTDPAARRVFAEWDTVADDVVAQMRVAIVDWRGDRRLTAVVEHLQEQPEFARRWSAHPVIEKRRGVLRLQHPDTGELRVAHETLALADDGQRLVTWQPADDATRAAWSGLLGAETPA